MPAAPAMPPLDVGSAPPAPRGGGAWPSDSGLPRQHCLLAQRRSRQAVGESGDCWCVKGGWNHGPDLPGVGTMSAPSQQRQNPRPVRAFCTLRRPCQSAPRVHVHPCRERERAQREQQETTVEDGTPEDAAPQEMAAEASAEQLAAEAMAQEMAALRLENSQLAYAASLMEKTLEVGAGGESGCWRGEVGAGAGEVGAGGERWVLDGGWWVQQGGGATGEKQGRMPWARHLCCRRVHLTHSGLRCAACKWPCHVVPDCCDTHPSALSRRTAVPASDGGAGADATCGSRPAAPTGSQPAAWP